MDCSLSASPGARKYFSPKQTRDALHLRKSSPAAYDHNHIRKESWYQDLLGHGLSENDIAALMGDGSGGKMDDEESVGEMMLSICEERDHSEETVMEQKCIMAIAEAKRRLAEMGFQKQLQQKQPPMSETDKKTTWKKSLEVRPQPLLLPPVKSFVPNPNKRPIRRICSVEPPIHFAWGVPPQLVDQQIVQPESDLEVGVLLPKKSKPCAGSVAVRCRGCRRLLSVAQVATLVRCPSCTTVSPASTTRT
ncbi:hypothetical protein ACA910_022235 [Epithemia clementina (nom. ined.)]